MMVLKRKLYTFFVTNKYGETMKDIKLALIYIILMIIIGCIAAKTLSTSANIIVSVFGSIGALLVAIFKFSADRLQEQENEILKIKRANYQKLLEEIGKFAYNKENNLIAVHTESWVFASNEIVELTSDFLNKPSSLGLETLLIAMRKEMNLAELKNTSNLVSNLYKKKSTGLA